MSHETWPNGFADLARRCQALRHASALPGADHKTLLDAAFAELDAAVEALTKLAMRDEDGTADAEATAGRPDGLSAERTLLRAVFQHAPAPLFLLEQDGTIRRANARAGELIGAPPGYATGKPLTAFVDLPSRAAVASHLAAAARTGESRQVECTLLGPAGPARIALAVGVVTLRDDTRLLVAAVGPGRGASAQPPPPAPAAPADAVQAMTRRMDTVTAVTRLLLDNSTFSEAVTLQRCARLLAGAVGSWAIVDMDRAGQLRRQFVVGPHDDPAAELTRTVRAVDPQPGTVSAQVHSAGKAVLLAHAEDPGILGAAADGTPLSLLLGVTSLLSVPISDEGTGYGVLTLARVAGEGPFRIADLALAEELGQHLGVAIRVDRMFRHRSSVAEALAGSLLPARLPDVPWLDLSAAYLPASEGMEVSGDFYDVFPVTGGWAITIGDVCGKGQEAAAMTAAARHAIRVLAHSNPDPADVLAKANEIVLAGDYEDRFVTAKLAYLRAEDGRTVRVTLASSGHPGPAVVRPDGRVDLLSGGGFPLGLFPDAEPDTEVLELAEGDLIVFYSDGVTDARSADMRYFEEQLADELAGLAGSSAAETARMVQGLVTGFSSGELRDDMTILVAKVKAQA